MNLPCEYIDIKDIEAPIVLKTGRKRFEWNAHSPGTFQLSNSKNLALYSITIWKNNGHLTLADGEGRVITKWHSLFTGSFNLVGGFTGPLYARCGGVGERMTPLCVTWSVSNE